MAPIRSWKEFLQILARFFAAWSVLLTLMSWRYVPLIGKVALVLLICVAWFVARKYGGMKGFLAEFRKPSE